MGLKYKLLIQAADRMMRKPALQLVLLSFCLFQVALGAVDSSSLLWPMPSTVTSLDSTVRALDPDKFQFTTDINSALLNQAFQRYMGILFKTPAPYYPEGAEPEVKTVMPTLNVKVMGGDETLKPDTDESCKCVSLHSTKFRGWFYFIIFVGPVRNYGN